MISSTPHLQAAHDLWRGLVRPSDWVVDATCGAGNDTLILAQLAGRVTGLDIQKEAIRRTQKRLQSMPHVELFCQCHSTFPDHLPEGAIRLMVYNLGFLPSSDRSIQTRVETTLASVEAALKLVAPGGAISLMCYPGHPEGARETAALLEWAQGLPTEWKQRWLQWRSAHLLYLERIADLGNP